LQPWSMPGIQQCWHRYHGAGRL